MVSPLAYPVVVDRRLTGSLCPKSAFIYNAVGPRRVTSTKHARDVFPLPVINRPWLNNLWDDSIEARRDACAKNGYGEANKT